MQESKMITGRPFESNPLSCCTFQTLIHCVHLFLAGWATHKGAPLFPLSIGWSAHPHRYHHSNAWPPGAVHDDDAGDGMESGWLLNWIAVHSAAPVPVTSCTSASADGVGRFGPCQSVGLCVEDIILCTDHRKVIFILSASRLLSHL